MTGAPKHLSIDGDYVLVRMALVDVVGLVPAVVFQRIAWRCELRPDGWQATLAQIAAECHLGHDQVKRATTQLRERGWLTSKRADRWTPTLVWNVVWAPASREGENPPHETPETPCPDEGETPSTEQGETHFSSYEDRKTSRQQPSSSTADAADPDPVREDIERICKHLADRIEGNGSRRPKIGKGWRTAARLLLDKDDRPEAKVHLAIDWCQDDEFWRSNILSMPTLRAKYDQLRLAAQRSPGRRLQAPGIERTPDGARAGVVVTKDW